jgi:hypothetical protein
MKTKEKNKILYLSPSSAVLYQTCPLLYKNKDIKCQSGKLLNFGSWTHDVINKQSKTGKDILKIAKNTFAEFNIDPEDFLIGKKMLENFMQTRDYLNYKTIDTEVKVEQILSNGIALKGTIDRIVERNKDTIEIIDYKSGFMYFSLAGLQNNLQLRIYECLIRNIEKYKKYENVLLTIDPLRYDTISIQSTHEEYESFLDWIEIIYNKINTDTEFNPLFPNPFCGNCYITNFCQKYKELSKFNFSIKKTIDEKAEHWTELNNMKKMATRHSDNYKEFFKIYMIDNKLEYLKTKSCSIKINSKCQIFIKKFN